METTNATKSTEKLKRSVTLSEKELDYIKSVVAKHETQLEAAISLKIGRETMTRLLQFGSCSETTYNKLFKN